MKDIKKIRNNYLCSSRFVYDCISLLNLPNANLERVVHPGARCNSNPCLLLFDFLRQWNVLHQPHFASRFAMLYVRALGAPPD